MEDESSHLIVSSSRPFYRAAGFIISMLVVLPPVGLLCMWLWAQWKIGVKIAVSVGMIPVIFIFTVFWFFFIAGVYHGMESARLNYEQPTQHKAASADVLVMEKYLEKKYGKDFVIKKSTIKNTTSSKYSLNTLEAEVYPTDDPSLTFLASSLIESKNLRQGTTMPASGKYHEGYLEKLWSKQQSEATSKFLKSLYGNLPQYEFSISMVGQNFKDAYLDTVQGTTPNFTDLTAETKSQLTYVLKIESEGEIQKNTIVTHAQKILDIAAYPKSIGINNVSLKYVVFKDLNDRAGVRYEWVKVPGRKIQELTKINDVIPYFAQATAPTAPLWFYNPTNDKYEIDALTVK